MEKEGGGVSAPLRWDVGSILRDSHEPVILNSELFYNKILNTSLSVSIYRHARGIVFQRAVPILLSCHFLINKRLFLAHSAVQVSLGKGPIRKIFLFILMKVLQTHSSEFPPNFSSLPLAMSWKILVLGPRIICLQEWMD